jgi:hypothetical protein
MVGRGGPVEPCPAPPMPAGPANRFEGRHRPGLAARDGRGRGRLEGPPGRRYRPAQRRRSGA